jgi:ribosome maturation protein SDO1
MVSVENAVIARLTKNKMLFEILVDPDKALEMKKGAQYSIENVLAVNDVFKDSKKGDRHTSKELQTAFGTSDVFRIAGEIIKEGEIQLTTEQRNRMLEDKKKEIASIISRQGIDPKTKLPHPPQRIMNAMKEARVQIDTFKPAKDQISAVLDKIQAILPISLERVEVAIRIPIEYAGKASSVLREIAAVKKDEWTSDSWIAVIEIPAGMQGDIYEKLNNLTSGRVQVKIIKEYKI